MNAMLEQAKKQSGDSKFVKLIACIMKCLTRCIESCLKYISTQAYIFTAIHGTPFWSSCVSLFKFLTNNPLRIGVAQSLGRIVVSLGRNFVVLFTMGFTFALITYVEPFKTQITSPYLVLFVIFCIAFVMCVVAFEGFGMGMDTLIMCFIADESMNGGAACHASMKEKIGADRDQDDFGSFAIDGRTGQDLVTPNRMVSDARGLRKIMKMPRKRRKNRLL